MTLLNSYQTQTEAHAALPLGLLDLGIYLGNRLRLPKTTKPTQRSQQRPQHIGISHQCHLLLTTFLLDFAGKLTEQFIFFIGEKDLITVKRCHNASGGAGYQNSNNKRLAGGVDNRPGAIGFS